MIYLKMPKIDVEYHEEEVVPPVRGGRVRPFIVARRSPSFSELLPDLHASAVRRWLPEAEPVWPRAAASTAQLEAALMAKLATESATLCGMSGSVYQMGVSFV